MQLVWSRPSADRSERGSQLCVSLPRAPEMRRASRPLGIWSTRVPGGMVGGGPWGGLAATRAHRTRREMRTRRVSLLSDRSLLDSYSFQLAPLQDGPCLL